MLPPKMPKQVCAFLGFVGYNRKFIKNFVKIAKPLTLLTWQQVKFDWTQTHHEAFLKLKESIIEAPILHYPDPNKRYIVILTHQVMPVECSYPRNIMVLNSALPFSHIPFQKHSIIQPI